MKFDAVVGSKYRKYGVVLVAIALGLLAVPAMLAAYAQGSTVVTTPVPVVGTTSDTLYALAGLIGAIGAVVGMLVPYISRINKAAGTKVKIVADSLAATDHYATDLAANIKKNEARAEAAIAAMETLVLRDPESQKKWAEIKATLVEKEKVIAQEAVKDTEEIKNVHDALSSSIGRPN